MNFPKDFVERLNNIHPHKSESILKGLVDKSEFGIRINTEKTSKEKILKLIDDKTLTSLPFIENAFITKNKELYTKNPLIFSGNYFVQDTGSMAIVEALDVKPEMKVLDICASPGSKSTHILSKLSLPGFLVANEVTHNRVGRLVENIGLWGKGCVMVTSQKTVVFKHLREFFDRILIDAPCSGEGMFAKNPTSREQWSVGLIRKCVSIQKEIITNILGSLKIGGEFVYSTCTMAPEENEGILQWLLETYSDSLELIDIHLNGVDFEPALSSFQGAEYDLSIPLYAKRIYPYLTYFLNQSFFMAKIRLKAPIRKINLNKQELKPFNKQMRYQDIQSLPQKALQEFLTVMNIANVVFQKDLIALGFHVYDKSGWDFTTLKKLIGLLHPTYVGVKVATIKKDRLEPKEELALSILEYVNHIMVVDLNLDEVTNYMNGKTVMLNTFYQSKYVIVSYLSYRIGIGKIVDKELKSYFNTHNGKKIN